MVDRNEAGRLLTLLRKVPMVVEYDDPMAEFKDVADEEEMDDFRRSVGVVVE